jgi:hypothetical protein
VPSAARSVITWDLNDDREIRFFRGLQTGQGLASRVFLGIPVFSTESEVLKGGGTLPLGTLYLLPEKTNHLGQGDRISQPTDQDSPEAPLQRAGPALLFVVVPCANEEEVLLETHRRKDDGGKTRNKVGYAEEEANPRRLSD